MLHCGQMKMKILTFASGLIASVLVFSFMLKVPQVHAQTSCNYYASPSGTGNGLSASTPFAIKAFWSIATPGTTLCLLDGTYTGDSAKMIQPPSNFAGTASQPITIRALNEGRVLFDGGGALMPAWLQGSYGVLEGVNLRNGSDSTLQISGNHWVIRKVIAWDAKIDGAVVAMAGQYNLLEDAAAFGRGRKTIGMGAGRQGPGYNILRRVWSQHNYSAGEASGIEQGYGQDNTTLENVVATWDNSSTEPAQVYGPIESFSTQNSRILGSIFYHTATDRRIATSYGAFFAHSQGGAGGKPPTHNWFAKHVLAFVHPDHPQFATTPSMWVDFFDIADNNRLEDSVGVGGRSFLRNVTQTNVRVGTSMAAAIGAGKSIWDELPGICRRYASTPGESSSTLTSTPLWPWPMNQRIKDALVQSGRAPVDITQTMEKLLGPISQTCTTGTPPSAATLVPRNLRRVTGAN
jgi:chondroitinase B-like protein